MPIPSGGSGSATSSAMHLWSICQATCFFCWCSDAWWVGSGTNHCKVPDNLRPLCYAWRIDALDGASNVGMSWAADTAWHLPLKCSTLHRIVRRFIALCLILGQLKVTHEGQTVLSACCACPMLPGGGDRRAYRSDCHICAVWLR